MSIYVSTSSAHVVLERWSIREADGGQRHFVGFSIIDCDGRVSTPIRSFDPVTRTGSTESGSTYQLVGRAGHDKDAEYVWTHAAKAWNIKAWKDVTQDLVPDWRQGLPADTPFQDDRAMRR
ncbi:hypothetical protein P0D72_07835 [Paraburkholderia sediminicola]|uniref:hypothetical protein n=1 Tax=Paraburkholderia sediminicola TaxID=458836 RepID=UPI0038B7E362